MYIVNYVKVVMIKDIRFVFRKGESRVVKQILRIGEREGNGEKRIYREREERSDLVK